MNRASVLERNARTSCDKSLSSRPNARQSSIEVVDELRCVPAQVLGDRRGETDGSENELERLAWMFAKYGVPDHNRSDTGSEFTARAVRNWLSKVGVKTLYIEP